MTPTNDQATCPHYENDKKRPVTHGFTMGVRWFANYLWISTAIATLVLIFHLWQVVKHLDAEATATAWAIKEQNLLMADQNALLRSIDKSLKEHHEDLAIGDTLTITRDKKKPKEK